MDVRGGHAQKRKAWQEQNLPDPKKSALAELLITQWGFGLDVSAFLIQQICFAVVQDGLRNEAVEKLAKIGSSGECPQNCDRDLKNMLAKQHYEEALSEIDVPLLVDKAVVHERQWILEPHRILACLYHRYYDAFVDRFLGGGVAKVQKFWQSQTGNPTYENNVIKERSDHTRFGIPIAWYGDAVPVKGVGKSWGKSAEVYSIASLLAEPGFRLSQFLVFIIMLQVIVQGGAEDTRDAFWARMQWSLYWLWRGVWPTHGPDGVRYTEGPDFERANTPLAGGFWAILWALRSDLEHFVKYKLENCNSGFPCFCCRANMHDDDLPWSDFRRIAKWRATIWTHVSWRAARADIHHFFGSLE